MNDVVVLNKKESIALIQIENPPVNALSHAVRQGLKEAVRESLDDTAIKVLQSPGLESSFLPEQIFRNLENPPWNLSFPRFATRSKAPASRFLP